MKQFKTIATTTTTITITIATLFVFMLSTQAMAQVQLQQSQAPTVAPQITAKVMQELQQQEQQLHSMLALIHSHLGNDVSQTHLLQIFNQLAQQGIIKCPTGFTSPKQCALTPPTAG